MITQLARGGPVSDSASSLPTAPAAPVGVVGLSARERAMLAFEHRPWSYPLVKEQAIRQRFALSPAQYYHQLNYLIDRPDAWAADPRTVKRLRQRRQNRREATSW